MDIAVLGDEDTVLGFKLAGVTEGTIYEASTVKETIDRYAGMRIIIMTEHVAEELRASGLMEHVKPVVAEIPGKQGSSGTALKNLGRLLEEAIGVQLKG